MPFDRVLTLEEALEEAARHENHGAIRCRALAEAFAPSGKLVMRTFDVDDREIFLDVAWQELLATRQLTPEARPRTLREVGMQVENQFGSFREIAESPGIPGSLRPEWFAKCAEIEAEGWYWEKLTPPWLVAAAPVEQRHSERTVLYVLEGNHGLAVLAHGLRVDSIEWRPLEAVVCLASREEVGRVLDGP